MVNSLLDRHSLAKLLGADRTNWIRDFGREFLAKEGVRSRPAYVEGSGVADMEAALQGYNRARRLLELPEASGEYADRREAETDSEHIARIHGYLVSSLRAGEPVVFDLKSYVVKSVASGSRINSEWRGLLGHSILVTGVRHSLGDKRSRGFVAEGVDSISGEALTVLVFAATPQDFTVWRGSRYEGGWVSRAPVLRVEIPELPMGRDTLSWSERTVTILNYVVWAETR